MKNLRNLKNTRDDIKIWHYYTFKNTYTKNSTIFKEKIIST